MGATFDPELVHVVGNKLIAQEAKLRAASVVLAPTCNIQRNPLGGRVSPSDYRCLHSLLTMLLHRALKVSLKILTCLV
jgi:hypothetical protein